MKLPKIGEKYRHYKSTGGNDHVYEIVGIAQEPEEIVPSPENIFVIYRPLYESTLLAGNKTDFFVRPIANFSDEVEIDGQKQPRGSLFWKKIYRIKRWVFLT